ncbi:YolD-like family protein [Staphylococcus simulans]|uniref:YolD-like family protein n=1 Tax=Staphylococcus simulans TaxID=1286 RepID=UPI0013049EAA
MTNQSIVTILKSYIEDQNKISKSELSQEQYDMLNENLHFKIISNQPATIEYLQDGYFHQIYGTIRKINMLNNTLLLNEEDGERVIQISMMNITKIL